MVREDETIISIRIDKNLAKAFADIAKANNRNKSILIRDFVQSYVKKNGQLELKL